MPQYFYRGRDRKGQLRVGQRFAVDVDNLNSALIREGISPLEISVHATKKNYFNIIRDKLQGETLHLEELGIFARQMQLLHQASVPMVPALKQLASYTRSYRLANALKGVIDELEMGQSLSTAMQKYPETFSPFAINIIQIGEKTGKLSEAFAHLHRYIEFETSSRRQIKATFRYPMFILIAIGFAFIVLNLFVIPTFSRFYSSMDINLPWQTRLLINVSNFSVHYGLYTLIVVGALIFLLYRYLQTTTGKYRWHHLQLKIPLFGKLIKRIILIRLAHALAITINAGIPVIQGLTLVRNLLTNTYINGQIKDTQEAIERGTNFTQAIDKIELFTPLEMQILSVGEQNGELGPALDYIGNFQSQEIEFDLKRVNDFIGPIMIALVSALILIVAMGVYLPIWNMINLVHS